LIQLTFDSADLDQTATNTFAPINNASGERGNTVMTDRAPTSSLTSRYDAFLFAPICEEADGKQLSVLSALARMNIDPWEEASRLEAMPEALAAKALVSTLNQASGSSCKSAETTAIAARLVQLLPKRNTSSSAATEIATVRAQRASSWLVWVGLAIAMSLLSPHHQTKTTSTGEAASSSTVTSASSTQAVPPDASSRGH
jgi:hypothetical protein